MSIKKLKLLKTNKIATVIFVIIWIAILRNTRAYYFPYVIYGMISVLNVVDLNSKNAGENLDKKIFFIATLFTLTVTLANYDLLNQSNLIIYNVLKTILLFISGLITSYNMFNFLYVKFQNLNTKNKRKSINIRYFLVPFFLIVGIEIFYLWSIGYPGNLTVDSISQLTQIQTGNFSNVHPYYHTKFVGIFYGLGLKLFGDIYSAIATYTIAQIMIMSLIYSFTIFTLYEIGTSKKCIILITCFYAIMPYNIIMTCTLWKDILFAGMCLLLITAIYRCRKNIGCQKLNIVLYFVSALLVCLFRSNGFFVFLLFSIVLVVSQREQKRYLIVIALIILLLSSIMKGPMLKRLNVEQPDTIEALSVPLQQFARVVYNGNTLTRDENEYVNSIMNLNKVKEVYSSEISDPIKVLSRVNGANEIINSNKIRFIKYWIQIGAKHPLSYVESWIDQTKGYWNSGYHYWFVVNGFSDNVVGLKKTPRFKTLWNITNDGISFIADESAILSIVIATGNLFWLYLTLTYFNIIDRKKGYLELAPALIIVLSLMIATPVFNEFRYAYGLYTMFPMAFVIAIRKE